MGLLIMRGGALALVALVAVVNVSGCDEATQPPYFRVAELEGTPYERGYQHGTLFSREIRSVYTQILKRHAGTF